MFDSTASINLEEDDNISDVQCFSSCKGLGGLTGASLLLIKLILMEDDLPFTLDINTYKNKLFTGPYHAICSLNTHSKNFKKIRENVKHEKKTFL